MKTRAPTAADKVLSKINAGQLRLRPRWQFAVVSVAAGAGLALLTLLTVFFANLFVYSLRGELGSGQGFGRQAGNFPWLALGLALAGSLLLVWMLKHFDFSYRLGRWLLAIVILASLAIGTALAFTSLNTPLQQHGPLRGLYQRNERGPGGNGTQHGPEPQKRAGQTK